MSGEFKDFIDLRHLAAMKDQDGRKPSFFFSQSSRRLGKTFSAAKLALERFENGYDLGPRFNILVRNKYEVQRSAQSLLSGYLEQRAMDGEHLTVQEKPVSDGLYAEVYLQEIIDADEDGEVKVSVDEELIGYVQPLHMADKLKSHSQQFSSVGTQIFDEFQPKDRKVYLKNEISNFYTIWESVARGVGQPIRDIDTFFLSNAMSLVNPYFLDFGITGRLQRDTKVLRGPAWVLQRYKSDKMLQMARESPLARALADTEMAQYSDEEFSEDSDAGVAKPSGWGESEYLATFVVGRLHIPVRRYLGTDYLFFGGRVQPEAQRVRYDYDDDPGALSIRATSLGRMFRDFSDHGLVRFEDQMIKSVLFDILA